MSLPARLRMRALQPGDRFPSRGRVRLSRALLRPRYVVEPPKRKVDRILDKQRDTGTRGEDQGLAEARGKVSPAARGRGNATRARRCDSELPRPAEMTLPASGRKPKGPIQKPGLFRVQTVGKSEITY